LNVCSLFFIVTLLSSEHEIQYVALRNINLILQKRPDVLSNEVRVFFTKYNDPPYVKLEKLEAIMKLASESNVEQVLSELKEYAMSCFWSGPISLTPTSGMPTK
jgi:AP-1 complex subunit beta-1